MEGMEQLQNDRHAEERGIILRVLAEDYIRPMTSMGSLQRTLDALGHSLGMETLSWHLHYLSDQGYIRVWRTKDMPNFRTDRAYSGSAEELRFARLLPLGAQLNDGVAPVDPKVRF